VRGVRFQDRYCFNFRIALPSCHYQSKIIPEKENHEEPLQFNNSSAHAHYMVMAKERVKEMILRLESQITAKIILLTVLMLVLAGSVLGQEEKSEAEAALANASPEQVGVLATQLLDELDSIIAQSKAYQERLSAASIEDSLVLQLQLATRQDRFMDTLHQLADIALESEGFDVSDQLRNRAKVVFVKVSPAIWQLISELRTQIDALRFKRPETAPADRSALEDKIVRLTTRLDRFHQFPPDLPRRRVG